MWTHDDTEHATRTRPPEPPDSLTPLSRESTQPIDPDAADRRRYLATDEPEYPRLRIIGECGVEHLPTDTEARPGGPDVPEVAG